jgi:hypothetical protein
MAWASDLEVPTGHWLDIQDLKPKRGSTTNTKNKAPAAKPTGANQSLIKAFQSDGIKNSRRTFARL